jgi:hypothetical protein
MTDNRQPSLDFGLLYRCDDEYRFSMRALADAYEVVGSVVAAGATGVDKGDLSKMFEPGSGRHMRFSAVFKLGAIAPAEMRRRALEPLARCFGFGITAPEPMSDKEKAIRLETALKSLGPIGEQKLIEAMGGRR